jgi:hypothetical protein
MALSRFRTEKQAAVVPAAAMGPFALLSADLK